MFFSSITFFVFLGIVLFLMLLLKLPTLTKRFGEKVIRNIEHIILLLSSYVFYGWWDWRWQCEKFSVNSIFL